MPTLELEPIGIIRSPYGEKFGIPRQSGLNAHARGELLIGEGCAPRKRSELFIAMKGLELHSHLWVLFWFHQRGSDRWRSVVRPPRLGGKSRMGVLATRSPHRPNPIGLSVVKVEKIDFKTGVITVSGIDVLDGTPLLDVKPYIPYADAIPQATSDFAPDAPPKYELEILPGVKERAQALMGQDTFERLWPLALENLAIDPRPAFLQRKFPVGTEQTDVFGWKLEQWDIKFRITANGISLVDVVPYQKPIPSAKKT